MTWVPLRDRWASLPLVLAGPILRRVQPDLVTSLPEANLFLVPSVVGQPDHADVVQPSFEGRLGADALVVGFPRAPEVVLGLTGSPQYFVVLEERMVRRVRPRPPPPRAARTTMRRATPPRCHDLGGPIP